MILTLTSFSGNVNKINLPTKEAVKNYIVALPSVTPMHTRLKFNCEVMGFEGFITGTKINN